ncbi:FadR family transcriptional regulator [Neisseriaceae bacterium TC5R-5]|nr:FadR family transcriptional regulator [Neisseriaceae bacterium TC5R-5]
MPLPTLKVDRLYRQISSLIIRYIQEGHFKVGEALPAERDLARQLGVGRSSVREALIALEIAGWVEIRTGAGVFICRDDMPAEVPASSDSTSAAELLEARSVIEAELAALAAERGSDEQIAALWRVLEAMAREPEENAQFHAHDQHFHFLIAAMTGNDILRQTAEELWSKRYTPLFRQLENHYGLTQWAGQLVAEHHAIYQAIAKRDPQAAREAMTRHLASVSNKLFSRE